MVFHVRGFQTIDADHVFFTISIGHVRFLGPFINFILTVVKGGVVERSLHGVVSHEYVRCCPQSPINIVCDGWKSWGYLRMVVQE